MTFGRIRPSLGRYDIQSNTSSTATYMYTIVAKLSTIDGFFFAYRFELNSMLCAFQNLHVRMAWNTHMHVECQNLIVYKAEYTRKREGTVFKTKYCISCLYTNFVSEIGHMKFSVYFGTRTVRATSTHRGIMRYE